MKGQYTTIQYVLFFAIGIVLVMFVYNIFSNVGNIYKDQITRVELQKTGELIRTNIVSVYEVANRTNSFIEYTFGIPKEISDCVYSIEVRSYLMLNCTNSNINAQLSLYNINVRPKIIYSSKGTIKIASYPYEVDLE